MIPTTPSKVETDTLKNPKILLYVFSPPGKEYKIRTNIGTDYTPETKTNIYRSNSNMLMLTYGQGKYNLGRANQITIYGIQAGATSPSDCYVCWSHFDGLEITSSKDTQVTSELGYISSTSNPDMEPLTLKVKEGNTHGQISIAVFPIKHVAYWVRLDKIEHVLLSPYDNKFASQELPPVGTVVEYSSDYVPIFYSNDIAQKGVVIWNASTTTNPQTKKSYSAVQYAYNTDALHPYPNKVETRQFSNEININTIYDDAEKLSAEVISFDIGLNIKASPLRARPDLMYPIWIYGTGIEKGSTWNYKPYEYRSEGSNKLVFPRRYKIPDNNDPYYTVKSYGGYSPCILGNANHSSGKGRPWPGSALPNCVGYATGRFNEIGGWGECKYLGNTDATNFISRWAKSQGLSVSQTPSLGACLVWGGTTKNTQCGHVAIVEAIYDDGSIEISESGWYSAPVWRSRRVTQNGTAGKWGMSGSFTFKGFIANPATSYGSLFSNEYLDDAFAQRISNNVTNTLDDVFDDGIQTGQSRAQRVKIDDTITVLEKQEVGSITNLHGMQLLTVPTLVESPFIEVKIGNYTFGSYTKKGTVERQYSEQRVQYPNYMESLNITKTNGAVNQYVLNMKYQIEAGEDPNLLDKIFSSVSDSRKITLTYGDWCAPEFIYRNEEAIITKVTSNVDFQHSLITYNVYCTSSALSLKSKVYDFPVYNDKPSNIIRKFLRNNSYGLLDIFYGMRNNLDKALSMIASDDKKVNIKSQKNVDILTYLNYLVSCMISNSNDDTTIQNAMYNLIIRDEVAGELEGPYFKVVKVNANSKTLTSTNVYEVDIGFPGETIVTDFRINNDNSWAILYNYDGAINPEEYVYKIDNEGRMRTEYSPNITTSDYYRQTTAANKTWWTKMTQFPITATLTIKGLIRPAMLMEQVRINAYFYGQRHISSGLYVITKQQDTLNSSGYKTTLTLLRVAGDEDKLYNIKQTTVKRNTSGSSLFDANGNSYIGQARYSAVQEAAYDPSVITDEYARAHGWNNASQMATIVSNKQSNIYAADARSYYIQQAKEHPENMAEYAAKAQMPVSQFIQLVQRS